ncbi:Intradiol ring-cleavage dioxygenase [Stachybotrys elegans]|uniref:Intradiol ring-cleavage dioxygenase n=1 Tax=Stachybotrys elegans TaxID=80388 RepID=A0A8K0SLN6_9HYPO|nr:Intradiol ring-cleavage dioxygenase [Stachybotrys elegans]
MHFPLPLVAAFAAAVLAHPGEDHSEELRQQRDFFANVERASLAHCAEQLEARGVNERNVKRRMAAIEQARNQRGIKKRDLDDVLNTDHNKTELGYTPSTPADILFAGQNSCVLTPEVTIGPYYVSGESIRRNLVEDQEGVDLILDFQVIDVSTCEPVPELFLEIWHCNSTGVYGGVVNQGNGDFNDKSNIDKTWARGIQQTDEDGVVQFETFFPGHYIGRATHIHLLAHANATLLANETLGNEIYSSHVGQTYFDQDLIDEVQSLQPYTRNTQPYTRNAQDIFLAMVANQDIDPVVEWTLLGDTVSEGLFAWYAYGINVTVTDKVTPAVFRYEEGGVANPDFSNGPPGWPPGGVPPIAE